MPAGLAAVGWLARLGLAGLLVWSLRAAFLGAPALNAELRSMGIAQDWRVPLSAALFDAPLYAYQMGHAEIFAERFLPGETPSTAEDRADRGRRAALFFETALRMAPADAYAWTGLAWSALFLDKPEVAASALMRSIALAPANLELSGERAFLAEALADIVGGEQPLAAIGVDQEAVCADFGLASRSRLLPANAAARFMPVLALTCSDTPAADDP